ncbi:MAG: serine/threonine-protein kinase [Kofleriaceae bacterium]
MSIDLPARYRILRRLGQGGMAEVFEAELVGELGFVRKVAIKRMLPSAVEDPAAAQRFLDEARIASKLHHANIIAILDLGLLDGLPFQVLELVDAIDAQALLARAGGTLPIEIALAIAADVAHALDHAHRASDADGVPLGIVHRDVKPSNVLVSRGGDVKLTDFGIAFARDRIAKTETGTVAGTLGFIAPEQRTRSQLDGRTDVFALALTLHALITGSSPLADVNTEMSVLAGAPIPLDPALPAELRALLDRALAPARTDRPSAGEFAEAIGAALEPRLTRDARSHLRDWIASITERPVARRGALDELLGIEVVAVEPAEDGIGRYATVAVAKPAPPPPPRRRIAPIALALIAAGTLAGIAVWQMRSSTPPLPAPIDAALPDTSRPDAMAITTPMIDAALDAAPVTDARRITHAPPRDSAIDAASPAGTAYLQVVGDDLVGQLVVVDGTVAGSVPNLVRITTGRHRVEIRKRDGSVTFAAKSFELEPFHTRSNPLKPAW